MQASSLVLAVSLGVTAALPPVAAAQGRAQSPRAEPRTLVGVVVDTAGLPVDSAEVVIGADRRRTVTGTDGTFRFENVRPARYTVVARKIGYLPITRSVSVGGGGAAVRFELTRFARTLPAAVTVATRGGLGGVISDTAHRPLARATIEVIGAQRRATSDAAGAFFVELDTGSYFVRVTLDGYATQMVGVRIPPGAGRQLAVWLSPATRGHTARAAAAVFDMNRRVGWRRKNLSRLFTPEDIDSLPGRDLQQLATIGSGQFVPDTCLAKIDGGPFSAPLWSFEPREIEFLEVYGTNSPARPGSCPASVWVWLKR